MTHSNLLSLQSKYDPRETMDRLEQAVRDLGMTVFARINFARDASEVSMVLPHTELLLFGNPKAGTILLQDDQRVGIDLPLKSLVWSTHDGITWVGVRDPRDFLKHYALSHAETVLKMHQLLLQIAQNAAGNLV